jgi:hypothetical protein
MLNDILMLGFILVDFALIIAAVFLLFLKTSPVYEFGYIARFIVGSLSTGLSIVNALHFNNGDIGVYGLSQPLQDPGLFWFFMVVAGAMFVYSVPGQVVMYIIERTGWLVAPVDAEIRKARRTIEDDRPYYSRKDVLGEDIE